MEGSCPASTSNPGGACRCWPAAQAPSSVWMTIETLPLKLNCLRSAN